MVAHSHLILRHNVFVDLLGLLVLLLVLLLLTLILILIMLRLILMILELPGLMMFVLLIFKMLLVLMLELKMLSVALIVIVKISSILLCRYEYTEGVLSVHAGTLGRIFLPRLQASKDHLIFAKASTRLVGYGPEIPIPTSGAQFLRDPLFSLFYLSFFASCTTGRPAAPAPAPHPPSPTHHSTIPP